MSDDYTDPSGDHASDHDDVNAREPVVLQIAIHAKSQDTGQRFLAGP